ncbi:MAG TPA: hypothetical protein VFH66_07920 [Mycobacteriales bacterium]|nr:hypothetical protein [Mycobacteriales bacterium]
MHPPQHAPQRLPFAESPLTRLATLLVVGAIGAVGLGSTTHGAPGALDQAAMASSHSRTGHVERLSVAGNAARATVRTPAVRRTEAAKPPVRPAKPVTKQPARKTAAPVRYIPTGTGIWLYEWRRSNHGNARSIVHRARQAGLSTLYLRTGSSWDGFSGGNHLRNLLSAARGTGLHVVAWDFPRLKHPLHDAHRLARAARVTGAHGARIFAVAPDIETPSEGTFNAGWRVRQYLLALRAYLPKNVTILTAVPWPSRYRIGDYPYGTVAAHSDVLIPMAYWYNNPPGDVTARSIGYLRRFHRPVQPVGQGYDGRLDVPGLRHNNLSRQVPAFFWTAHVHGARAVSLWSWQAAPPVAWHALVRAHRLFPSR